MPPQPANRRWDVPSRCGGSRAAAADADLAAITVEPGPRLIARLRDELAATRAASFLIQVDPSRVTFIATSRISSLLARHPEAVVFGSPVADTCKEVIDGLVIRTVPRDALVDARGPWLFERGALEAAVSRFGERSEPANMLDFCRAAGLRVHLELIQ